MIARKPHQHRAAGRIVTRAFSAPVAQPENRAAHGNVCQIATCSCGAVRHTNVNGLHIERGPWLLASAPRDDESDMLEYEFEKYGKRC